MKRSLKRGVNFLRAGATKGRRKSEPVRNRKWKIFAGAVALLPEPFPVLIDDKFGISEARLAHVGGPLPFRL